MPLVAAFLFAMFMDPGPQERLRENAADQVSAPAAAAVETAPRSERTAGEIVADIERSLATYRRTSSPAESLRAHRQIAALVDELKRAHPDDPGVAKFLPDRWFSLRLLENGEPRKNRGDSRAKLHAEIREVLDTTNNPLLRKEAQFLETMLRFQEPLDGPAAASLAEEFVQKWPDDERGSELLFNAAEILDTARFVRIAFVVALVVLGGPIAFIAGRRTSRPVKLVMLLGLLAVVVALAAGLAMLQLLPNLSIASRAAELGMTLLHVVWTGIQGIVLTARVGLVALLSGVAAAILVRWRHKRRSAPGKPPVREWIVGFAAALALCSIVDAALIARESATFRKRIVAEYPDSFRGRMLQGQTRQHERLGQPFELDFVDAISGRPVSMKDFRGKLVVVDFWATWCGPCRREMPELKRLYAQYHDRGVEFIGVSQDLPEEDGGLDALKAFVAKEEIPWPQFYSGGRSHRVMLDGAGVGDFSEEWGIEGVPTVFLVDANGNLYSADAGGQLETLITSLLGAKH